MRTIVSGLLCVGAVATVACGDDKGGGGDDTDACVGHLCGGPDDPKITDPEGGNVIFEYIYLDSELQTAFGLPAGVTTINRTMAYFVNSMTPNSNPLPTGGVCNNLVATKGWPITIPADTVDLDVGSLTITGKNTAGTDVTMAIAKQAAGKDSIQRPHTNFYQLIQPNADQFLKPDSSYTVAMGGAGAVPATTFTDGLFLAQDFTVNSPDLEGNGPLVAGTDFPVKWTPGVSANLPAGNDVAGITWLVTVDGSPTHACITDHAAGAFTIPGSTITEYKAIAAARGLPANKAILLRNALVHRLARLPNGEVDNKRRLDMLTLLCWAQLVDVN